MKVLLVDHAPIIGGVEMMIRDLLGALDLERVAPVVVTDMASPMRGRFSSRAPEIALSLTRLKGNPLAGGALFRSALQLARVARQSQAQVLQTFTARTHLIGSLAGLLSGVPVVWRINDETLPRPLTRLFGRVPRRIIVVSRYLQQHYGRALRVTDVIPDGVPLPPLRPPAKGRATLGLPAEAVVVTLVGRLVRWKGQAVFLNALAALKDMPVHGLLVGGWSEADNRPGPLAGGQAYHAELLALAERLALQGRVTFAGHTDAAQHSFAASDIVAHTSTLPEPFGRVIIEAMAAGRAVVAADAGGAREIVQPGVTGLLTPPGDAAALAGALRQLAGDRALREGMGHAGRERAEAEYSVEWMAGRFEEVWDKVRL